MFSKKKENTAESNQGSNENNTIKSKEDNYQGEASVETTSENFNYNNNNPNLNEDLDSMPRGNTQIAPKAGFSFVKKSKAKSELEGNVEISPNYAMNTNSDNKNELSVSNPYEECDSIYSARPNENISKKKGFNFIKKINPVDTPKNENNFINLNAENKNDINTSQNESILNKNYLPTGNIEIPENRDVIDNSLNKRDNIFYIIQKDIDSSYLSGKNNANEIQVENTNNNQGKISNQITYL